MDQAKPFYKSKGVIGAVVVLAGVIVQALGYSSGPDDQELAVTLVSTILEAIGGMVALWGRVAATKQIKSIKAISPPAAGILVLACAGLVLGASGCATVEKHQEMQTQLVKDVMAVAKKQPETIKVLEIEAHDGQPITINAKRVTVQVANATVVDMLRAVPKLKAPYEEAVNSAAGGLTNALTLFTGGYWVDRIMATAMSTAGHNTTIGGDNIGRDKAGRDQVGGDWTGGDKAGRDGNWNSHNTTTTTTSTENHSSATTP